MFGQEYSAVDAFEGQYELAELKAAAQGIDDEGMQEANPNLHLRAVAQEMWSILELVG